MNRRGVVSMAGLSTIAVASTTVLPAPAATNVSKAKRSSCEVAVIGGGLAGLNAALHLQEKGFDVQLIEARARAGGRLETATVHGLQFELGAVEVGENYQRFLARAKQLNVSLQKPLVTRVPGVTVAIDGSLLSETGWAKSALNPMADDRLRPMAPNMWLPMLMSGPNPLSAAEDWMKAAHQSLDVSLKQYLQQSGQSDAQVLRMMEIASNYNDFNEVSALDVLRRDALRRAAGPNAGTLAVVGGSQALPNAMAAALHRPMQQAAVSRVERAGLLRKRYVLSDSNQEVIAHAKSVVIAVAAPCMQSIQIDGLPDALAPLWARPMTRVTTVHFRVTGKFWESDGFSPNMWIDGPLERVFAVAGASGEIERLIVWINGRAAAAVDALGQDLARFVTLELSRIRPSTQGKLTLLAVRSWGQDPFSGGAYVEIAAGKCGSVARASAALNTLPPGLALAGEHMVLDYSGMEAAMASGERAAQRVLD